MSLHALDTASWMETIWDALADYRENSIPEGDPAYDGQWSDICTAMGWVAEAVGAPEMSDSDAPLNRADALAIAMMQTRPDLREMSLDEWLIQHDAHLSPNERAAGQAILALHYEIAA
jgi:hypothetical protein